MFYLGYKPSWDSGQNMIGTFNNPKIRPIDWESVGNMHTVPLRYPWRAYGQMLLTTGESQDHTLSHNLPSHPVPCSVEIC